MVEHTRGTQYYDIIQKTKNSQEQVHIQEQGPNSKKYKFLEYLWNKLTEYVEFNNDERAS